MNLKVLLADDDEIVLSIHTTYLKKSGLSSNPLSFSNGKDILDYILMHQDAETIYLIFLDINMPILNGWEFLDEINTHSFAERIYIVLVTSSINKIDKQKALNYKNAIDFLEKPINMEDCIRIKSLPQISACFQK
jgi:CheY-like chemotaxis protein